MRDAMARAFYLPFYFTIHGHTIRMKIHITFDLTPEEIPLVQELVATIRCIGLYGELWKRFVALFNNHRLC